MPDPLDTDAIAARLVSGYESDPPEERLPHAIDDGSLMLSEIERLRDERGFWREATEHLSVKRGDDAPDGLIDYPA